jgi:hypothetical protein
MLFPRLLCNIRRTKRLVRKTSLLPAFYSLSFFDRLLEGGIVSGYLVNIAQ